MLAIYQHSVSKTGFWWSC